MSEKLEPSVEEPVAIAETPQDNLTEVPPPVYTSSEWDYPTKRTVIVILIVMMGLLLWLSRSVIPLIVISFIIAYLIGPLVDLCERLRLPRGVTTIFLFVLLLVAVILLPVFLLPVLITQLASLSNFDVPSTARYLISWFNDMYYGLPDTWSILGFEVSVGQALVELETNYREIDFIPSIAEILTYIQRLIGTATNVVGSTAIIGFNVVGGIFQLFITFLVVFFLSLYMTKDAPLIRSYVAGLFPSAYQSEVVDLLRRMGYIWQAFFRGQLLLSVVVGLVTWGALTAVGMPGALILGIVAGALEVVPNLGPTIAMIPAVLVALIQGSTTLDINHFGFALVIVAMYFIIQQLENNILVPRIIGDSVNLHPIVVICGVVVGFRVFGIMGALLAAPAIASLRVLGSYIHAKLLGYPPLLGSRVTPTPAPLSLSAHGPCRADGTRRRRRGSRNPRCSHGHTGALKMTTRRGAKPVR